MNLVVATVMFFVAVAVLSLASLVGHLAGSGGILAILMGGFAAVMLCVADVVPASLTLVMFQLAFPVCPVAEAIMVARRRRRRVVRRGRRSLVVRRRPGLCEGRRG
jgi:hypothetical protein